MQNLMEEVERVLYENDFSYATFSGCFDIVAKKEHTFLLKILTNIDSMQTEQAKNLKILASNLFATSLLIGMKDRREILIDNIVYERFGVPTVTVKTFENIINQEIPIVYRSKGGLFAEIDPDLLVSARKNKNMTQKELAERVGITKKSIYEHESRNMKALLGTVESLEDVLGERVSRAARLEAGAKESNEAGSFFERVVSRHFKRMGFETDFLYKAPFNLIAKKGVAVIADAESDKRRIEKRAPFIRNFSEITGNPFLVITKEEMNLDVPYIEERDLRELDSSNHLFKKINRM